VAIRKAIYDDAAHSYVDPLTNIAVPSVTMIRDYFGFGADYRFVKESVMEFSSDLGTAVDEAISLTEQGYEIDCDKRVVPFLDAYLELKHKAKWEPQLIHNGEMGPAIADVNFMPVGFCSDMVGVMDGREAVVELKRTANVGPGAGFQTAGYDLCFGGDRRMRAVFHLLPGKYKLWTSDEKDSKVFDKNDYAMFSSALAMAHFQLNKKLISIGDMKL
jgi:hypothetical protein